MTPPDLSPIQFAVLGFLVSGPRTGKEIREYLDTEGESKSLPAFYQFMSRIDEEVDGKGFVRGWYEKDEVRGQIVRRRHYELTLKGSAAYSNAYAWYRDRWVDVAAPDGEAEGGVDDVRERNAGFHSRYRQQHRRLP